MEKDYLLELRIVKNDFFYIIYIMSKKNQVSDIQNMFNEEMLKMINPKAFIKSSIDANKVKNIFGFNCENCGSDDLHVEIKQTRSIDEESTKVYHCNNCGYVSKKAIKMNEKNAQKIKELIETWRKQNDK